MIKVTRLRPYSSPEAIKAGDESFAKHKADMEQRYGPHASASGPYYVLDRVERIELMIDPALVRLAGKHWLQLKSGDAFEIEENAFTLLGQV